jgi:hypothetical protein
MKQQVNVVPHGLMESGFVSLLTDPTKPTSNVTYTERLVGGIGPFTSTDSNDGALSLDPALLNCKSLIEKIKAAGGSLSLDVGSSATIILSEDGIAQVSINLPAVNTVMNGVATLDLSGDEPVIEHIVLTGTLKGYSSQTLELKP